ncbi:hypothetical protein AB0A69_20250 [Streptomyces sp. NPDC045431]|uniref:DUF6895 family protein n=1 Tax=Streptomyces sp. NPDC045431 TaxID=3155613 RepID=UPI00341098CD
MTAAVGLRGVDLRGVGEAALGWISGNRADFRLGDSALDPGADVNRIWKPLGELAQVCVCVRRYSPPGTPLHDAATDLLAFAWRETGEGELFLDLQRLEPCAMYPLEIYAAFASAGLRHPGYEEFASAIARTRGWRATEQHPTRLLSVLNSERRTGLPDHEEMSAALGRTWLGALPEPWLFETTAGYATTHVVFHLTDWGRATDGVPPWLADYLETWLPPWLDTCLDDRQWDLSCELLAVAASLPRPPERAAITAAWAELAGAQDASGALVEVGPTRHRPALPHGFAHRYHSTLMAAFAAALTLARLAEDGAGPEGPS